MEKQVITDDDTMTAIANAIRDKTGKQDSLLPSEMPEEINGITGSAGDEKYKEAVKGIIDESVGEIDISGLNITKLRDYCFYNLKSLSLKKFPENIVSIGCRAFQNCKNLTLTSLPEQIASIDTYAFESCKNLALTSLPEQLTEIRNGVFSKCDNLKLTLIHKKINKIGGLSFQNCIGLEHLTFLSIPQSIANDAFKGCTNLLEINVPWSEGEVANAPWGAINATINYNVWSQEVVDPED